jgi:hypothetical protein
MALSAGCSTPSPLTAIAYAFQSVIMDKNHPLSTAAWEMFAGNTADGVPTNKTARVLYYSFDQVFKEELARSTALPLEAPLSQ